MIAAAVAAAATGQASAAVGNFDYQTALASSLLFYEAQRSGPLDRSNTIPWRANSAMNDRGMNGEDLTGGYVGSAAAWGGPGRPHHVALHCGGTTQARRVCPC